jgi:hypothetical protein
MEIGHQRSGTGRRPSGPGKFLNPKLQIFLPLRPADLTIIFG